MKFDKERLKKAAVVTGHGLKRGFAMTRRGAEMTLRGVNRVESELSRYRGGLFSDLRQSNPFGARRLIKEPTAAGMPTKKKTKLKKEW